MKVGRRNWALPRHQHVKLKQTISFYSNRQLAPRTNRNSNPGPKTSKEPFNQLVVTGLHKKKHKNQTASRCKLYLPVKPEAVGWNTAAQTVHYEEKQLGVMDFCLPRQYRINTETVSKPSGDKVALSGLLVISS